MANQNPMQYTEQAQNLRKADSLLEAGAYYTSAAYGWLMQFRSLPSEESTAKTSSTAINPPSFGYGLRDLLFASVCYRLGDSLPRCQNHCRQGILISSDLIGSNEFNEPAEVGLCYEAIGDFKVVGDLENWENAYEKAENKYLMTDDYLGWQAEPEFEALISPLVIFAKSCNYGLTDEMREKIMFESLIDRIEYKNNNFKSIVNCLLNDGNWDSSFNF